MATFRLKTGEVEARQHQGSPLTVINDQTGESLAQDGDYLLGTVAGKIIVVPKATFEADYEPFVPTVGADEFTAQGEKLSGLQTEFDALKTEYEQLVKLYAASQAIPAPAPAT